MQTFRLSTPAGQVERRMRERLRAATGAAAKVVWRHKGESALLHTDALQGKLLDGWIVCELPMQTDQTGPQTLQVVYYVGTAGEADGLQAAGAVNAPNAEAARLADAFGAPLQRVLWDAVLDCLEGMLAHAAREHAGQRLTLAGYYCSSDALSADVVVGEL